MDTRIWTDNCPRCCTTCAPADTSIVGDQRSDDYRCRCGRSWTTARSLRGYEGFDSFAPLSAAALSRPTHTGEQR